MTLEIGIRDLLSLLFHPACTLQLPRYGQIKLAESASRITSGDQLVLGAPWTTSIWT